MVHLRHQLLQQQQQLYLWDINSSGNASGAIYNDIGINYILKASIAESTKVLDYKLC